MEIAQLIEKTIRKICMAKCTSTCHTAKRYDQHQIIINNHYNLLGRIVIRIWYITVPVKGRKKKTRFRTASKIKQCIRADYYMVGMVFKSFIYTPSVRPAPCPRVKQFTSCPQTWSIIIIWTCSSFVRLSIGTWLSFMNEKPWNQRYIE